MNIHHIVSHIHNEASGPSHTVPALCDALARLGESVTLHVLENPSASFYEFNIKNYHQIPILKPLGISPEMHRGLIIAARQAHIFHNHGLWMMPNIYPGKILNNNSSCKFLLSPRGMLSPYAWNRSKLKKRLVWLLGQNATMQRVDCFHATAEEELIDIRRLGFRQPVAIIPNGVIVPELNYKAYIPKRKRKLLFLARIHPQKGIDFLLRAWKVVQDSYYDWELIIAGPDNVGYLREMKKMAIELGLSRIEFPGPVYGAAKSQQFFSADIYVLPTRSENFGISVAEALAHGTPAIVTKGAPWAGLEEKRCGWWINIGEAPLAECLREAMSKTDNELSAMGERGRAWMKRDFSWKRVGEMMHKTYLWLLGGGQQPEWVRIDG